MRVYKAKRDTRKSVNNGVQVYRIGTIYRGNQVRFQFGYHRT